MATQNTRTDIATQQREICHIIDFNDILKMNANDWCKKWKSLSRKRGP